MYCDDPILKYNEGYTCVLLELFQISLMVQRVYGSEGKIEVTYRSIEISAQRGLDFFTTETNAIVMDPGVTSSLITIQVSCNQ